MKKCAYCLKRITGKPYKKGKKFFCSPKCKEEYYLNDTKTLTKELDKAMSQLVRSKGVCVIAEEGDEPHSFNPITITDCLGTDFIVDGIVRKMLKENKDPLLIFNNEKEMEDNSEVIQRAFKDLTNNDDE